MSDYPNNNNFFSNMDSEMGAAPTLSYSGKGSQSAYQSAYAGQNTQNANVFSSLDSETDGAHENAGQSGGYASAYQYIPGQPGSGKSAASAASKELLDLIRSPNAVSHAGGRLFRRTDSYNFPIISFAVPDMTEVEVQRANDRYVKLCRRYPNLFLSHDPNAVTSVSNYTVFDFVIGASEFTLGERKRANSLYKQPADLLMRYLVDYLCAYSTAQGQLGLPYDPLCCLSLETIIMSETGAVKVLPLLSHRRNFPVEMPSEVALNMADERSDLYSAAYVVVEMISASRSDGRLEEPKSLIIQNCIKTIQDWRPGLAEAYEYVRASGGSGGPRIHTDANGNAVNGGQGGGNPAKQPHENPFQVAKDKIAKFLTPDPAVQAQNDATAPPSHAQKKGFAPGTSPTENETFSPKK